MAAQRFPALNRGRNGVTKPGVTLRALNGVHEPPPCWLTGHPTAAIITETGKYLSFVAVLDEAEQDHWDVGFSLELSVHLFSLVSFSAL